MMFFDVIFKLIAKVNSTANSALLHFFKKSNRYFNNLLFDDKDIVTDKDTLEYWKSYVFYILSVSMLICGAPLMFFGAYVFYKDLHNIVYSIIEFFLYFVIAFAISRRYISIIIRKSIIVIVLYLLGLFLLITVGLEGGGLILIFFSLMLAGCLLNKKQIIHAVLINLIVFILLTFSIIQWHFVGTSLESNRNIWLINSLTAQVCGIILIVLMNTMYNGLYNQNQLIKNSKESLVANEMKHKAMIANISDVLIIADENGIVQYSSPNVEQRFGLSSEYILGKPILCGIHPDDLDRIQMEIASIYEVDRLEKTMETRYISKIGEVLHLELTAVNLKNDPNIKGMLITYHDITSRKMREEEILYLSYHDSLTGLYNRLFFENEKVRFDKESHLPLSVIAGDINGLKIINDALGHAEGDKLLIVIAEILQSCCRKNDVLARIGGDEFSMLLPCTSSKVANEMINQIDLVCKEYNNKMSSELYHISVSLGYATKTKIDESFEHIVAIAEENLYRRKLLEGRSYHSSIMTSMKTVLFEKSQETEEHAQRLITLTNAVGQVIGLTNQQFDELELFSLLHDIGKIGIDDQILNKPGKLTDQEWVEMKKHSEVGYRISMASPELMSIAPYILTHHERWDGKGYPQGLMGKSIPLLSRILSVADSYDAMTEDRIYRKAMLKQDALAEIRKNAGTQFDPEISEIFVCLMTTQDQSPID